MTKKKIGVVGQRMRFDNWIKTYHDLINKSDMLNGLELSKEQKIRNLYVTLLKMLENENYSEEYKTVEVRRWIRKFDKKCVVPSLESVVNYLNKKAYD